jgi:hypothetical protein
MRAAGATGFVSVGSGQALLEWLLAEHAPCTCVDTFHDDDQDEWLIAPVRRLRRRLSLVNGGEMQFVQCKVDGPTAQLDLEHSMLLFCWGLCTVKAARSYVRQLSARGRAVAVIDDETCCPRSCQVRTWLGEEGAGADEWTCTMDRQQAASLGPPCSVSIFTRTAVLQVDHTKGREQKIVQKENFLSQCQNGINQ